MSVIYLMTLCVHALSNSTVKIGIFQIFLPPKQFDFAHKNKCTDLKDLNRCQASHSKVKKLKFNRRG